MLCYAERERLVAAAATVPDANAIAAQPIDNFNIGVSTLTLDGISRAFARKPATHGVRPRAGQQRPRTGVTTCGRTLGPHVVPRRLQTVND